MIYLTNSISKQTAQFPRYTEEDGEGSWSLTFKQPSSNVTYTVARIEATLERQYISVSFRLPDVVSVGEYIYTLTRGEDIKAHGIAVIGEYHEDKVTFEDNIEIKQYGRFD